MWIICAPSCSATFANVRQAMFSGFKEAFIWRRAAAAALPSDGASCAYLFVLKKKPSRLHVCSIDSCQQKAAQPNVSAHTGTGSCLFRPYLLTSQVAGYLPPACRGAQRSVRQISAGAAFIFYSLAVIFFLRSCRWLIFLFPQRDFCSVWFLCVRACASCGDLVWRLFFISDSTT